MRHCTGVGGHKILVFSSVHLAEGKTYFFIDNVMRFLIFSVILLHRQAIKRIAELDGGLWMLLLTQLHLPSYTTI